LLFGLFWLCWILWTLLEQRPASSRTCGVHAHDPAPGSTGGLLNAISGSLMDDRWSER